MVGSNRDEYVCTHSSSLHFNFTTGGRSHEHSLGFFDSHLEGLERAHVLVDLGDWKLDEHTSDLGSLLGSGDHLDELKDMSSNLLLHVRVSLSDGGEELHGTLQVSLLVRHVLGHHVGLLRHAWLLGHHLVGSLGHSLLVHHWGTLVVVVVCSLRSGLVLSEVSSISLDELLLVSGLLSLDELEQLLNDVGKVGLGSKVVPVVASGDRLVLVPISLVSELFLLEVADFLDLVVVDDQSLTVVGLTGKSVLGLRASVGLFEANESEGVVLETLLESNLLDLSIGGEESGKLVLSPVGGEVLDVQVASLLRCLVADGLDLLLAFTLNLVEEVTQVHFETVAHVLVGKSRDSSSACLGAVLLVLAILVLIADESVLAYVVIEQNQGFDITEGSEEGLNVVFSHVGWDVLEVEVVHYLLLNIAGVLGSVSEHFV
jgi:hypothetical protein